MRWIWIDQIVEFEPDHRLVAVKCVAMAETYLSDHFERTDTLPRRQIMPAALMIEGMAQSSGILVGSCAGFTEKVILAKINRATLEYDVVPGETIRYDTTIERFDTAGAATSGTVEIYSHTTDAWLAIGRIDLLFSHIDRNMSGLAFPDHNFVFDDNLEPILATYDHPKLRLPDAPAVPT